MTSAPTTARVVRLRRILLLVLVLFASGIVALFFFGRAGTTSVDEDLGGTATREPSQEWDEGVAVQSQGFDFTLQQEGRPVFRIHGDASRSDRDDNVFLERVVIVLPREDGEYEVTGDSATYDQRRQEAKLEGNVVVHGPHDIRVQANWLELRNRGSTLVASEGTEFGRGEQLQGRAEGIRMDLEKNVYVLSGGVTLESGPAAERPFELSARRVLLEQQERRLLAEGKVTVDRDFEHLEAERLTVFFDADLENLRFLRALRGVKGRMQVGQEVGMPAAQLVHLRGDSLAVLFDVERPDPVKMELEGKQRDRAMLRTEDAIGSERRLVGLYITADLQGGLLRSAEILGPMYIVENIHGENGIRRIRTANAETRGDARFDGLGNLSGLTLEGSVVLKEADVVASGDRAFLDLSQSRAEIFGDPVNVTNSSGELVAPHVTYSSETGLLHAVDGVRATLSESATGEGGPLGVGAAEEPVRVEASEAFLRGGPEGFLFRGDVRAWQGNNLLLAEQLRGEGGERMSASGGVKTVWRPKAEPETEDGGDETQSSTGGPVEITSQNMSYARGDGVLLYNEDVRAKQAGRTLSCNELSVELSESNEAERLQCRGRARLVDPPTGRTILGDEAIYYLEPAEVEFFGDPLTLRDPQRGRIEARRLRYRLEDGQMWMGAAAEPSQPTG